MKRPKQTIGKRLLKHRANKLQKARIRALKAMNQIIENVLKKDREEIKLS